MSRLFLLAMMLLMASGTVLADNTDDVPPVWDRSSLEFTEVRQECRNNEVVVCATIKNGGDGDMQTSSTWGLYFNSTNSPKDGEMVAKGEILLLKAGKSHEICQTVNATGNYMYKAFQNPGNPGQGDLWSKEISVSSLTCGPNAVDISTFKAERSALLQNLWQPVLAAVLVFGFMAVIIRQSKGRIRLTD